MLLQLTAKHFCAGLIVQNGRVTVTAPILRYMHGWMLARVEEYAQAAGWTVMVVRAAVAGGQIPSEQLSATSAPSQR